MNSTITSTKSHMPLAIYALMLGAFGIGTTEFVIMGLLPQIAQDFHVGLPAAGILISGYAIGVAVGALLFSLPAVKLPRKTALILLMLIFTIGNLACALASSYESLMIARIVTSFAHGTFFGIGAVLAASLAPPSKKALAIALMFTGLTVANIVGVPFGTWLGQLYGWRATFWTVAAIGPVAMLALALLVPKNTAQETTVHLWVEVKTIFKPAVLTSLLVSIIGFSGVFAVFTYIAPILTNISGFSEKAISPILFLFGLGFILGNIVGGKLADKKLMLTLLGTLIALAVVLFLFGVFSHYKISAVIFVGLLGFTGFATVPPLQMQAMEKAGNAPTLASALNIAAFNIGNALGAWVGGLVLDYGYGLNAISSVAGAITVIGVIIILFNFKSSKASVASAVSVKN